MIQQIEHVIQGEAGISGDLTDKLVAEISRRGPLIDDCTEALSAREGEVLPEVAQGATDGYKDIASPLFISENTVRAHVGTMMQKLHQQICAQLALYRACDVYALEGRAGRPPKVPATDLLCYVVV